MWLLAILASFGYFLAILAIFDNSCSKEKPLSATYPQTGHVFANLSQSEKLSEAGQAEKGAEFKVSTFNLTIG